jgi:hypothetical protein
MVKGSEITPNPNGGITMRMKAASISCALLSFGLVLTGATAQATSTPEPTLAEQAATLLPASERSKWEKLTPTEKDTVNEILQDPSFGIPGSADSMEAKYEALEVVTTDAESNTPQARAAAKKRTTHVEQNWKILNVTYASIKTYVSYDYVGSKATKLNSCTGVIVNYVPMRQFEKNNTSSLNNDGTVTCRTEVWLSRPLQGTAFGIQGLRVNGSGTIVKRWNL